MPRSRPSLCDCGRPAVTKNVAREWVCERCRRIERRGKEIHGQYANNGRPKDYDRLKIRERTTQPFQEFLDPQPIIAHESIARLERMLLTATEPQV